MTIKKRYISGKCNGCEKIGPYNKMRAWSFKELDRLDYAFCSEKCARNWEKIIENRLSKVL